MQQPSTLVQATLKRLATSTLGWKAAGLVRRPGALILLYHRIRAPGDPFPGLDVDLFRAQMRWLAVHCAPIGPDDLRDAVTARRTMRPPVLVTFDDGYRSYREQACPVLRELGIPAVLFLATAYIDDPSRPFWWDTLRAAIECTTCRGVELPWAPGTTLPVDHRDSRQHALRTAKEHLKSVPEQRREAEVADLLDRLGAPTALSSARQMLDWDDVRAILDITRIGAHSHTHPILSAVDDDRLEYEVATCRARILAATGLRPRWFAYPNGRACDIDGRTRAALSRHGFDVAFTTIRGVAGADVDWMELPRFTGDGTLGELAWRLSVRARN